MARKKSTQILGKPKHITVKDKDLENIVALIGENPTGVKLTRAGAVRVAVAFLHKTISEADTELLTELEVFFKKHKAA